MKILQRSAALFALAAPASAQLGDPGWRMTHLDMDVTVIPGAGELVLEGVLRVRLDGEPSRGPTLGLNSGSPNLRFAHVGPPDGASAEPNAGAPGRPGLRLAHVRFDAPQPTGTEVEIAFACESEGGGQSNQLQVAGTIAFASWVEGWYPVVADPRRTLSQMGSASGATRFHLPAGWDVVSNGKKGARVESDGGVSVAWSVEVPVARSFAAGPYRAERVAVGERSIGVYLLSEKQQDVRRQAETLARALAAQEQRFGPYPYASYAIAEVPEDKGSFYASSEQGFVMAKSSAFEQEHGNLPLWAHEMAHGWWGNLVGNTGPGAILCGESLAQYGAVLAIEALEGEDAATEFLRFSRSGYSPAQCARGYFTQNCGTERDRPLSQLGGGGWQHDLADAKGHWVYHMLRGRIGDELFFEGLRALIANHAAGPITLQGLREHFVALAPDAELERFFEQWLDRVGAPVLEVEWEAAGEGGVEVAIMQVQEGPPYLLELEVAVRGGGEEQVSKVTLGEATTRATLPAPAAPSDVVLDPRHRLLIWEPEYGERR